jgi:hypothetical protein
LLKSKIYDQHKKNLKKTPREIQSHKLKMCGHHKKIGNKKKINKKLHKQKTYKKTHPALLTSSI